MDICFSDQSPADPQEIRALEALQVTAQALARDGRIGAVEFAHLVRVAKLLGLSPDAVASVVQKIASEPEHITRSPEPSPPGGEAPHPPAEGTGVSLSGDGEVPEEVLNARRDSRKGFGKYTLLQEIKSGGQGTVWRAWTELHGYVALKLPRLRDRSRAVSFFEEAKRAGRLNHPNIVPIFEVGFIADTPFMAMPFIRGATAGDLFRVSPPERAAPPGDQQLTQFAVALVADASRAIHFAHENRVVHLDVKPDNVMIASDGHCYVVDFGIAQFMPEAGTATTMIRVSGAGTPPFKAPEQVQRVSSAPAAIDVYGLGATLYALLTGRYPFWAPTREETERQILAAEPTPLRRVNPGVPVGLEAIVLKAMNKSPRDRFETAAGLAEELEPFGYRGSRRELMARFALKVPPGDLAERKPPMKPEAPREVALTDTGLGPQVETRLLRDAEPLLRAYAAERVGSGKTTDAALAAELHEQIAQGRGRFGKFVLLELISQGGFGRVYRALETGPLRRVVALKIAQDPFSHDLDRFLQREAAALSLLNHPGILPMYEIGKVESVPYVSFRYVEGADAAKAIEAERPEPSRRIRRAVEIMRQAARILEHVHSKGLMHRDVKPSNILVDREGCVYLTDFALATGTPLHEKEAITETGTILGTPGYMSPEQWRGKRVDRRSDVYQLGASLYHLATGLHPHAAATVQGVMREVLEGTPPIGPRRLNRKISRRLEKVILRAMAPDPGDRFQTAGELGRELELVLQPWWRRVLP